MNTLVWSPVFKVLEEKVRGGDDIIIIIVPFAKVTALKQLHWVQTSKQKIKVVCRWAPQDLVSGVSDLEVYTYLREQGCELYLNPTVHLKLYIFEDNVAFNTSGNLTLRGLGYSEHANIEVGNMVQLSPADWASIFGIIEASRRVDDAIFERYTQYVQSKPSVLEEGPPVDLLVNSKIYTISSLPATETPQRLAEYYFAASREKWTTDEIRRAIHDLVIFGINSGLSDAAFDKRLGEAFRKTPFVAEFVEFLRVNGSLRFGAVNDWLHQKCEDVPLPYRWELKANTRSFYNWLAWYFAPDITWDVPGQRSQVIYWRKKQ